MSQVQSFADEIETAANGEPIEAIVLASSNWEYGALEGRMQKSDHLAGRPISWAEARPYLDYTYDNGFGGQDCHSFTAWTASRVLFVHEYDGATGVVYVPRNPCEHEPQSSGLAPIR
jgi:hypothetical protein